MDTKTKYLLIGVGVIAAGAGGYFLYKYYNKRSENTIEDFTDAIENNQIPSFSSSSSVPKKPSANSSNSSGFPLKMKSRGSKVKALQAALIKKYPGVLPKYQDDGVFGDELRDTLIAKGLPTEIDKDLYEKIIAGNFGDKPAKPDNGTDNLGPASIADLMYSGIIQKSIDTCLRALFKIGDVKEYIKVNEVFKTKKIKGETLTIVTALSHVFPSGENRRKYRSQLFRIGLKWHDKTNKWTLSGFGEIPNQLTTIKRAKIWDAKGNSLFVPTGTIIGSFLMAKNGLTQFQTLDGRNLFVETTSIKYHHD